MFIKHWILLTALLAVVYAATEPLDLSSLEESKDVSRPEHVREKRFLAKKALLIGSVLGLGAAGIGAAGLGAAGLGIGAGLVGRSLLGGLNRPAQNPPIQHNHLYNNPTYYHEPSYAPNYGVYRGGSRATAYASAGAW